MKLYRFPDRAGEEDPRPEWMRFIWAVNGQRPDTFGAPELLVDSPRGMLTEKYPDARVIMSLRRPSMDEGIRIVLDNLELEEIFDAALAEVTASVS